MGGLREERNPKAKSAPGRETTIFDFEMRRLILLHALRPIYRGARSLSIGSLSLPLLRLSTHVCTHAARRALHTRAARARC